MEYLAASQKCDLYLLNPVKWAQFRRRVGGDGIPITDLERVFIFQRDLVSDVVADMLHNKELVDQGIDIDVLLREQIMHSTQGSLAETH